MSTKNYYVCDGCDKPIGNKVHLSIVMTPITASGIALPPQSKNNPTPSWRVVRHPESGENFKHFHNGGCIGEWADREIEAAIGGKKS